MERMVIKRWIVSMFLMFFLLSIFPSMGKAVTPWYFSHGGFKFRLAEQISGEGVFTSKGNVAFLSHGAVVNVSVPYKEESTITGYVESQKTVTVTSDDLKEGVVVTEQPYVPEPPPEPCGSSQPDSGASAGSGGQTPPADFGASGFGGSTVQSNRGQTGPSSLSESSAPGSVGFGAGAVTHTADFQRDDAGESVDFHKGPETSGHGQEDNYVPAGHHHGSTDHNGYDDYVNGYDECVNGYDDYM